ncbi:MAG: DNA polymerase III subunit gamma/tau [Chitinophagaceae bacterium]|nr:DNA polymerase III subunit gamma/tau [Chitinophagaceae bacterium]MCW5904186.1 DNA polymerase III subunit gamma/tau [Chitinophagaceae bacterium]
MDKFIVSARKYRPQTFETVVGQAHITTTLKNAIKNNQLAHAFLFCGPRGVGKTTCARILAKTINCENLQEDGEACNQCANCKSFNEGGSLNIHELDAASNNSVEGIRTLIDQVRFAPQTGKYKVYIVDEVHALSTSAFNAFLKTLEEPPPYAIFILATTEKHKITATILSRCQIFDFKRITTNDIVEHLQEIIDKENVNAAKDSLQVIAQKSEGCMRDALSILDKIVSFTNGELTYANTLEHLNVLDHDYYFKILETLQNQDMATTMLLYDEINRKGFEGDIVLNGFAEFIRNILVCKDEKSISLLDAVEGLQEKYKTVAQKTSLSYLISALNILNEAEINFKMARNKRLHIELTLIKLNFLQQAITLAIDEKGTVVKKKQINNATTLKFRQVESLKIKTKTLPTPTEAKLYVQEPSIQQEQYTHKTNTLAQQAPAKQTQNTVTSPPKTKGKHPNLLEVLREKAGNKYSIVEVQDAEPLQIEKLKECWNNYIEKLKNQGNKYSTIKTFELAQLEINNELSFTVTVTALTQQRFIEQEKTPLLEDIQTVFKNRGINFVINLEDNIEPEVVPLNKTLSSQQKFELIAQQYPLVKELKEKLNLGIDFL